MPVNELPPVKIEPEKAQPFQPTRANVEKIKKNLFGTTLENGEVGRLVETVVSRNINDVIELEEVNDTNNSNNNN